MASCVGDDFSFNFNNNEITNSGLSVFKASLLVTESSSNEYNDMILETGSGSSKDKLRQSLCLPSKSAIWAIFALEGCTPFGNLSNW